MDSSAYAAHASAGPGIVGTLIELIFLAAVVAGLWKLFEKAGEPGWAAVIPVYNLIIMAKLSNKPLWWGLVPLIPCVGWIFGILLMIEFVKAYGKSVGYAIGCVFLSFIFLPMLGFSDAQYVGTKSQF